jgi:hypothetical protein
MFHGRVPIRGRVVRRIAPASELWFMNLGTALDFLAAVEALVAGHRRDCLGHRRARAATGR